MVANGHIQDNIERIDPSTTYRQPTVLVRNGGGGNPRFIDAGASAGEFFSKPLVGRGLAVGDCDNDAVWTSWWWTARGRRLLLRNESSPGNWLRLRLKGKTVNRDVLGSDCNRA